MGVIEVLLTGVALSMDACAVGMTNGMCNAKMPFRKAVLIGGLFGFFQFLMPLIGYYITGIVAGAFLSTFEKISSWVSFILLAFLGGKMVFDCVREWRAKGEEACVCETEKTLTLGKLLLQAVATSIDALAVGVVLYSEGVTIGAWGGTAMIGVTTLVLSTAAVYIGKLVGNKLADKAEFCGGLVLIAIGLKILIEGLL
ncbi:MAG: manganese efflux pump [Clostridia bacterium]|nr:manganese efflux pump [Clostridia bacterium]